MSFTNTHLPCELPIFKDKVMYISSTDSSYKMEQSYVISSSFKGILRLSPNNYNTIYETNPVEFTSENDNSISFSYSDAIVFDDNAIVPTGEETEAKKVNADIRYRMITGSDSDGYLVNFRMSDTSVEFDNLGVIGITKTKKVTLYSDSTFSNQDVFILGNTLMPSLANQLEGSRAEIIEALSKNEKKNPEDWDEVVIDVKGEGDNSYLLSGYKNKDGKREFKFTRSHQFIKDIITEALLSFQSVPTGSVHWVPVSVEQYKALIDAQQYPNHYYKKNNEGNNSLEAVDPIVRDYLICDGRKYPTKEFPELAKILWKEKITYWDSKGKINTEINGEPIKDMQSGTTIYPDYFRVPDLRTKFISYVFAKPATNALLVEPEDLQEFKSDEHNIVGTYTPDNAPKYPNGKKNNTHFHFSAYGSYNGYNLKGNVYNVKGTPSAPGDSNSPGLYSFQGFKFTDDLTNNPIDKGPRIWYLSNTTGDLRVGYSATQDGNSDPGWGYGFSHAGKQRRWVYGADHIPVNAYASAPSGGHKVFRNEPTLGRSSFSKSIAKIPESLEETYKTTDYEKEMDDFYNPIEKEAGNPEIGYAGIGISDKNLQTRYGHENAPKYYTMLPLIKI